MKLLTLILTILSTSIVNAYVAQELSRGTLELKAQSQRGFAVKDFVYKRRVTYFCLQEIETPLRAPKSWESKRCFYVPNQWQPVHLYQGYRVAKVRYQLKGRISNRSGQIPVGKKQYFYPVQNITLVSSL